MKNRIKKLLSLLLAVIMLLCAVPFTGLPGITIKASAASYPSCIVGNYLMEASIGETIRLVYAYSPAFKNEKLISRIYNSYGDIVADSECQMYNTSSFQTYNLFWDTEDYEPDMYKVVMTIEFYSNYQWNTAPRDAVCYVTLRNNINNGEKDRNKYTGQKEYFNDLSNKSAIIGTNTLCTAPSAWQNNEIKSERYSIQLKEMYVGNLANTEVKNENRFNISSSIYDQWILMNFRITNNSGFPLDVTDILSDNNFYKYTGTMATVYVRAVFSDKRIEIYDKEELEDGESQDYWIGLLIPHSSGMPYLRLKNGNGYTFINTNPDLLSGKKKAGHSFGTWKTTGGYKARACTVCNATERQKITKQISKCSISAVSAKVYTGKAITPAITVMDGNKKLKAGKDYTVTYKNNKAIGKATVTIKGIESSGYTGTKSIRFKIIPATPKPTVTAGNKKAVIKWKAVKGADSYTVYYSASKNSGYKKIATTAKTAYRVKNLKSGRAYYFKVVANKKVGKNTFRSVFSSPKKAVIK